MARRCVLALLCAAMAVRASGGALQSGAEANADDRWLVHTGAAPGSERVDVHAGSGVVSLSSAQTDRPMTSVRLTVNAAQAGDEAQRARAEAAIAAASLDASTVARALYLGVRYATDTDAALVHEEWTVTLPAATDAEVEMASGRIFARDMAGRLDLRLGVGTVKVSTSGPQTSVRVSYGDVSVQAVSDSPGQLFAASGAGRTNVTVDGRALAPRRAGPGAVVSRDLGGEHDYTLRADVGNVELHVRPGASATKHDQSRPGPPSDDQPH